MKKTVDLTKTEDAKLALKRELNSLHIQDSLDGYAHDLVDSGCAEDYDEAMQEILENIVCAILSKLLVD